MLVAYNEAPTIGQVKLRPARKKTGAAVTGVAAQGQGQAESDAADQGDQANDPIQGGEGQAH
jgi:hypothetical protein